MIYSETQIEDFMYAALKEFLEGIIQGKVYKSECRPLDSKDEDAVVGVSSADAEQLQRGFARVNLYANDINNGTGSLVPSKGKLTALGALDSSIVDILNSKDARINWRLRQATRTYKSQDGLQHFASVNLEFNAPTF